MRMGAELIVIDPRDVKNLLERCVKGAGHVVVEYALGLDYDFCRDLRLTDAGVSSAQ